MLPGIFHKSSRCALSAVWRRTQDACSCGVGGVCHIWRRGPGSLQDDNAVALLGPLRVRLPMQLLLWGIGIAVRLSCDMHDLNILRYTSIMHLASLPFGLSELITSLAQCPTLIKK